MQSFTLVDYIIFAVYLLLSCFAGLLMARRATSSIEHYFLGGRSLPWWMLGIAGMAGWFDLTGTMIITSFLYLLGPRGLYVEFRGGAVLVLAFLLAFTGKWHRRSGCMTSAEWMTYRFGESRSAEGLRLLQAVFIIFNCVFATAYLIRGATLFLGMFFPFPPAQTVFVFVLISTLYTLSSGFYGVVLTDLVQGTIVLISCFIISIMAWNMVPSAESLRQTAFAVTGNANWTDAHCPWYTPMPEGHKQYELLMMMAMFYLVRNIIAGFGVGAEARYFGAKSDREVGLQSLLNGVMVMFRWPLMIGFAVMGIYLVQDIYPDRTVVTQTTALIKQHYPEYNADTMEGYWHDLTSRIINNPSKQPATLIQGIEAHLGADWQKKLPLVGFHGAINPEQILPAVLLNKIPWGLKGILVVAMFAAMMSNNSTNINNASALCVKDVYQNFIRPEAKNRELIIASYVSSLMVMALGFYLGVGASSINGLWSWMIMSFGAGSLAPLVLRLYWWRCNATGMFGGILAGLTGSIVQYIFWREMPEWQQFLIMTTLSFVGTIGGSYLAAPTPMKYLKHFYRTTRPFGLWKPLRDEFQGEERAKIEREHRNDIITVPFTLLWQVTLFLLPMLLVIKAYESFFMVLPFFLVGAGGMYWFWWRNMPQDKPAAPAPAAAELEEKVAELEK